MKEYEIIEEGEVKSLLDYSLAVDVIEQCFIEKSKGNLLAHPKVNIQGKFGSLRITPGESLEQFKVIGFRLYDVIRKDFSQQPQPIIVYDNETGKLKGIIVSQLLGAYRTAAINTVMQKHFNTNGVDRLGVVGTGFQAGIHTLMYAHALQPKEIYVYGRTRPNVDLFLGKISQELSGNVLIKRCDTIEELAEIKTLLLATRSSDGLLDEKVFTGDKVITTIGPKLRGASEVSSNFAKSCDLIVTDSIEQVRSYGERFFVEDLSKVRDFAEILKEEKASNAERVLLCSVGMGGTEVALADALIRKKKELALLP